MRGSTLVVHSDPDILGGTPVFRGTRVPFRNLIDYLERATASKSFSMPFPQSRRSRWWPRSQPPTRR